MYEKKDKVYGGMRILISVMLLLFCILKVIRGANTSVTTAGGLWNYISLFYYVVAAYGIINQRVFRVKAMFVLPLAYCVIAMCFALTSGAVELNKSGMYDFLMLPYFFLVFVSFYLLSSHDKVSERIILFTYIACLLINAFTTVLYLQFGSMRALANDVYFSLCLMPFALIFIKNKIFKTSIVVLQFLVSFLANKRAGFIALCVGLVLYYLIETNNSSKKKLHKVLGRIVLIIIAIYLFYRVSYYIDTTFDYGLYNRLNRIAEDDGSGRGSMYAAVWEAFWSSDWIKILFGHGMNTAGDVIGAGHAHNDFLEIMYNYGIIALLCIIGFYITIIAKALLMIKRKSPYAPAFAFSVVIGLTLSMFSYFLIYYTFVTCIVSFWGYTMKMEELRLAAAGGTASEQ